MSRPPVKVNQNYFSLTNIGASPDSFKLSFIGFQNDRGISVIDKGPVSLPT